LTQKKCSSAATNELQGKKRSSRESREAKQLNEIEVRDLGHSRERIGPRDLPPRRLLPVKDGLLDKC